jgi:hypothetical protein
MEPRCQTNANSLSQIGRAANPRGLLAAYGHATLQSTEIYLRADPTEKLEALAAMQPPTLTPGRFKAPDKLIAMLQDVRQP